MKQIVVGVDGSAESARALSWAMREGVRRHQPVRAVAVWSTPAFGEWNVFDDSSSSSRDLASLAGEAAAAAVARALADLPERTMVEVDWQAAAGAPGPALVKEARDALMLVVGGHGAGRRHGLLTGSTTSHCLHHSHTDLVVVPARADPGPASRVVVGLDGSSRSGQALEWAWEQAGSLGVPLLAVRAWPTADVRHPGTAPPGDSEVFERGQRVALDHLREQVAQVLAGRTGVQVAYEAPQGPPVRGLLDLVKPDDLLVVGSRGLGGFRELLLGSVSRSCVEHSPCPVVVVRSTVEH